MGFMAKRFDDLARWLPYPSEVSTLENFFGNKFLYPQTLAQDRETLYLEQALAIEELSQNAPIFLSAEAIQIPDFVRRVAVSDADAVFMILNGLAPSNFKKLPNDLGSLIAPVGQISGPGLKALHAKIDLGLDEIQELTLPTDQIALIPVRKDQNIKVSLNFFQKLTLNSQSQVTITPVGGKLGLIFDTRGRPFVPPTNDEIGRSRLASWRQALQI